MGGRDHSCEDCGRGGFNDPDGYCECSQPGQKGTRLMQIQMVDPQQVILEEIADGRLTRDDVALTYAIAIRQKSEMDWPRVNAAILERWSMDALFYIKRKAWAVVEGRDV